MVNDVKVDEVVLAMEGSIDLDSGSDVEPPTWQDDLQSYRLHIAFFVEYSRISPYLRAFKIFDQEDDEEINNPMLYPTNSRRMSESTLLGMGPCDIEGQWSVMEIIIAPKLRCL